MDISRTLIGTAANATISGGVNLYKDVHFPDNWSRAVSFTAWDVGKEFDITILEGKASSRAALAMEFGFAGPNWGGRMFVEGSATANSVRLNVQEDDFKAGMLFGVAISPQLALNVEKYTISTHLSRPHIRKEWSTVCDLSIDMSFDLVGFLYNQIVKPWLIDGIKDLEDEIPLAFIHLLVDCIPSANPNLIASANHIMDAVGADGLVADWVWDGMVMSPDLNFEWDLIEIAAALAETVALIPPVTEFGVAAAEIDSSTKWLRPKVSSGPMVGVVLDVHLKISGLTAFVTDAAGNQVASVTTRNIRTEGAFLVADVDSGGAYAEQINQVGVEFTHRAGITFEIGWHVGVFWLKILGYDFQKLYPATELFDVLEVPISELYRYRLTNSIGNTTAPATRTLLKSWVLST